MATSLNVVRLRIAVAVIAAAAVLAIVALWPAPRRGLVLYVTSDSAAGLAKAFSRESGVPVTVVRISTGPMLARIAAEAHRPRWTLAWVDGDVAAAALDMAGLLEHNILPTADWTATGRRLVPATGAWVPTGVTPAGVTVKRTGATGPTGMPDPAISGPAFPEIAGLVSQHGGWPRGKIALRTMRDAGLSVAPTSPAVIEELRAGRIGTALIQSSTAFAIAARDPAMRVKAPDTAFLMPGVLMMARGLSPRQHRDAERFIAFLLSARAHRMRMASGATDSFYWPVIRGFAPLAALPPLETIHTVHLEPYRWAPFQAEITGWFESEIARR